MATSKKAQYAPSSQQVDLEARVANGNKSTRTLSTADGYEPDESLAGRDFRVEGNETEDYLNTGLEYQTYANDTEAPARAEDGVEQNMDDILRGEAVATSDGVKSADEVQELKDAKDPLPVPSPPVTLMKLVEDDDDDESGADEAAGTGQSQSSGGTGTPNAADADKKDS